MAGGLLNLISTGNQNLILNGNPSKTFFKVKYAKYTNFGLQKFRIDYDGLKTLRLNEDSHFRFKIPRYADILMDTYVVVNLPIIWSPIYSDKKNNKQVPYEFRWIENLGSEMIREISITCGGQKIQSYPGSYIRHIIDRDDIQESLFNNMTGNVNELNSPEMLHNGNYPSTMYTPSETGSQPSILGRRLIIPIGSWFTLNSKLAFPLVALQYNELHINITFRPISELFTIKDVADSNNNYPIVSPNFNNDYMQLYRFLQSPPSDDLDSDDFLEKRNNWNADIHLISTYGFLSDEESKLFASQEQKYLFKEVQTYKFLNITGNKRVELDSKGLVSSWIFYFQRNDVSLRNQWSNYSNLPYKNTKNQLTKLEDNIYVTGDYDVSNNKEILQEFGFLLDGNYRETNFPSDVYRYIEPYYKSGGQADTSNYVYYYNFCLKTDVTEIQPSGAMNLNKFKKIELEFSTATPPLDENAEVLTICDDEGNPIGVNKESWSIYNYNYDFTLLEERYNVLSFIGGNCGLLYSH
tara:strand:- start:1701 stop:3269 length:1569 start_codon:yes stop_codon:yes gene_type:complete